MERRRGWWWTEPAASSTSSSSALVVSGGQIWPPHDRRGDGAILAGARPVVRRRPRPGLPQRSCVLSMSLGGRGDGAGMQAMEEAPKACVVLPTWSARCTSSGRLQETGLRLQDRASARFLGCEVSAWRCHVHLQWWHHSVQWCGGVRSLAEPVAGCRGWRSAFTCVCRRMAGCGFWHRQGIGRGVCSMVLDGGGWPSRQTRAARMEPTLRQGLRIGVSIWKGLGGLAERLARLCRCRRPPDQRSQERTPKKNHKAEREKLKRDQLNDLFLELSSMLDLDRQNSGKASVLGDAARVLRDLITQVESLRKEQSALLGERQYVSSEKNELLEENTTIKARISELQNELRTRMGNNNINLSSLGMSHPMANATNPGLATQPMQHQIWSSIPNLSSVAMTHSTNTVSPLHSQQHRPAAGQDHASRPQELQLFPGPSSSPEHECSHIRSTPASTSSLTDSLPGQLQLSLPQSSQERSSNCVSRSRREQKHG
ncbi:hypothetical protein EJB05_26905, partial [Eragrostis curvula]